MATPRLHSLNLNALVALDALLTECNVTRAARRVGITQPAMSQTLARLRELFDDPLLVRKGRTMVLSPRAAAMMGALSQALVSVERAVQLGMGFDPSTSTRTFRIALSDLSAVTILPAALGDIAALAPGARVQIEPLSVSRLADKLASGEVDLALAVYLSASDGLSSETLATDEYVCLVRRRHPLARRKRLRIADYAAHEHVAYTPLGFVPEPMSVAAPRLTDAPGIHASIPYLLALPAAVRKTDLVATVPRRLLDAPIDLDGLVTIAAPAELPPVAHAAWWHPRFDFDPAHQWLRARIRAAVV